MEFKDILSIAIASLIVIVVSHIAAFWVIRTLYPPVPVQYSPPPLPPTVPVFTETPSIEQQNVTIPTYETPVFPKPISKEELRGGPPPAEATAIQRESGVASSNPQ